MINCIQQTIAITMESSRLMTILSTLFSTISLLLIITILPTFFNYIQRSNTALLSELYKCYVSKNFNLIDRKIDRNEMKLLIHQLNIFCDINKYTKL